MCFINIHKYINIASSMNDLGFLGRGWTLSLPRNRHDESWRGGMTLPSFLEKSGFTGVNCRFRGMLEGGSVFLVLFSFIFCGGMVGVARSLLSSKRRVATVCVDRALTFIEQKRAWSSKLGLRCSIWFALDEWKLGHSWSVRISAGGMFELFGAMYIQSFTLTSYLWRHFILCSVLSIKL